MILADDSAVVCDGGVPDHLRVYREQAGTWTHQVAYNFPVKVLAADGDWMIAGAPYYDFEGAAYALRRVNGNWQYFQFLGHPNWNNFTPELFGWAVDVDGERAAISNPDHNGLDTVHVWKYSPATSSWDVEHELTTGVPPASGGANFGAGVALRGDDLLVASESLVQHFHYDAQLDQWLVQGTLLTGLRASGVESHPLAWSASDVLAVGDPYDDDFGSDCGVVYVLERHSGAWSLSAKLHSISPQPGA